MVGWVGGREDGWRREGRCEGVCVRERECFVNTTSTTALFSSCYPPSLTHSPAHVHAEHLRVARVDDVARPMTPRSCPISAPKGLVFSTRSRAGPPRRASSCGRCRPARDANSSRGTSSFTALAFAPGVLKRDPASVISATGTLLVPAGGRARSRAPRPPAACGCAADGVGLLVRHVVAADRVVLRGRKAGRDLVEGLHAELPGANSLPWSRSRAPRDRRLPPLRRMASGRRPPQQHRRRRQRRRKGAEDFPTRGYGRHGRPEHSKAAREKVTAAVSRAEIWSVKIRKDNWKNYLGNNEKEPNL